MYAEAGLDRVSRPDGWRRFRTRFPERNRVFLPVLYVAEETQALCNTEIAVEAHADGVFLINNGIGYQRLLRIAQKGGIHFALATPIPVASGRRAGGTVRA